MFRYFIMAVGLCISLTACSTPNPKTPVSWSYGTGSNVDITRNTRTEFYQNGKLVYADREAGGGGLPTEGVPVPDSASIEMVSFYDRKRYRIKVDLPADLAQQMRQRYQIGERIDQRNWLYFGLAPGGYYEVLLFGDLLGVSPDLLLARGIAEEVNDDWRDKVIPLEKQYEKRWADFDKEYGELFKQHPIPLGMDWAPIMDAYRANQPKTDQQPIN
ncbi:DUF2931 family protein [Pectobacterium versatile]